jgi:hypothetical protein
LIREECKVDGGCGRLSESFAIEAIFLEVCTLRGLVLSGQLIQPSTVDNVIVITGFGMGIRNGTGAKARDAGSDHYSSSLILTVAGQAFESFIAGGDAICWQK